MTTTGRKSELHAAVPTPITTCTKERLLISLDAVSVGRISHPNWKPVIECHRDSARMVATNLLDYVTSSLGKVAGKHFDPTPFVPTQVRRLVRGLKNDDLVSLESVETDAGARLRIKTPGWAATLPHYSTRAYTVPDPSEPLDVPANVLDAMRACAPAASSDMGRPTLTNVWTFGGATMATDSFWLLAVEHGWKPRSGGQIGISATVARHIPDDDTTLAVHANASYLAWGSDGSRVVAALDPRDPPDWRKLPPKKFSGSVVVARDELLKALALCMTPTRDQHIIRLTTTGRKGNRWIMESQFQHSVPSIDAEIPINTVGSAPPAVAFGAGLLRKLVGAYPSEDLVLRFVDQHKPVCIDQSGIVGLLMPVRTG